MYNLETSTISEFKTGEDQPVFFLFTEGFIF